MLSQVLGAARRGRRQRRGGGVAAGWRRPGGRVVRVRGDGGGLVRERRSLFGPRARASGGGSEVDDPSPTIGSS